MTEDFSGNHSGLTISELKFFRQLVSDIKLKTAASFVPINTFHSSISCHSVSHSSPNSWIIDSGASEHMTGNSSLLQSYHYVNKKESVRVANGTHVPVHGWGTSNCLPSLPLSSVLHVPSLSVNLLSVHKITEKLNCSVTFFPSHCVFQDLATGKILGSGKVVDGLYIMEGNSASPSASYQALNRWGYYPLILIGSWAFGTINRIHDFIEPGHKIFWLSVLDVGMAALMGLFNSIAYGLNSSVRRAIHDRLDLLPESVKRWLPRIAKIRGQQEESELLSLKIQDQQ